MRKPEARTRDKDASTEGPISGDGGARDRKRRDAGAPAGLGAKAQRDERVLMLAYSLIIRTQTVLDHAHRGGHAWRAPACT